MPHDCYATSKSTSQLYTEIVRNTVEFCTMKPTIKKGKSECSLRYRYFRVCVTMLNVIYTRKGKCTFAMLTSRSGCEFVAACEASAVEVFVSAVASC